MDEKYYHSIEFHPDLCSLSLNCMRVCPTQAIRIRNKKIKFLEDRCIDCGECIKACPKGAITPKTDVLSQFENFKYLVAVPSPTLFTQFGKNVTPYQIFEALKSIGFNDVYPMSWACDAGYYAIKEYVKNYEGDYPLISSSCPVVIRLLQVNYPEMVKQIIPVNVPKEIAAKTMKRQKAEALGISVDDIGAIYITPCAAKLISIKQPAEKVKSHLDGAVSFKDIYNSLYAELVRLQKKEDQETLKEKVNKTQKLLGPVTKASIYWTILGDETSIVEIQDRLIVSGLQNVIRIFEDVEKNKLRNLKYLECHSCPGGCIGGTLTVENVYVARSTALYLFENLPDSTEADKKKFIEMFYQGVFSLEGKVAPRVSARQSNIIEAIARKKQKDGLVNLLPGIDCGICGAPTCECFAEDVSKGFSELEDCIFFAKENIPEIIDRYNRKT